MIAGNTLDAHPRIGSLWSPDGVDVCEVRAACTVVVVVKWLARRQLRKSVYHGAEAFYAQMNRYVEPFDPAKHIDHYAGLD